MAVTKTTYTQAGSTTQYAVPFEVIAAADIDVYIEGVLQLQQNTTSTADATHPQVISGEIAQGTALTNYTVASNNGTITFNAAPTVGDFIVIERTTADAAAATFVAGSTIRAQDLNNAFDQVRFVAQEAVYTASENVIRSKDNGDSFDAIDQRIQNLADGVNDTDAVNRGQLGKVITDDLIAGEGIDLTDATGGSNSNKQVTISAEFSTDSNPGIITVDATAPITRTYGANGQLDLSIADGAIDIAKIDPNDIVTLAEQNAGPSVNDTSLFTSSAAAKRFDTIVQLTTPAGTDYEVGKTWLQNDEDKTVSIWNGSAWVAVASGGAFTELAKVVYVDATNGDDSLAGHRISNPKRTIKAAMDQINAETDAVGNGSLIIVAPGIYGEQFPITIEKNDVSIVGTSLRNCIVHPAIGVTAATAAVNGSEYRIRFVGTTDFTAIGAPDNVVGTVFTATGAGTGTGTLEDTAVQAAYDVDVPEANELQTMFQVNSGTYIQNLTLQGMKGGGVRGGNILDTDATFGLPTNQGWNFAFFPGATIRKSPYIQNCTNFSDSQINNVNFTPHVPGEGAAGDLDSGFAGGGILIDGDTVNANSPLRSMVCDSYTHTALNGPGIFVTNNGYTQVTSSYAFFTHYHLKCLNGGQANLAASTSDFGRYSLIADGRSTTNIFTADLTVNAANLATTFTIGQPTADASWHGNATRPQPNMLVVLNGITYPILSSTPNGLGWDVEISRPDPANRSNNLGLNGAVNTPATAQFFLRSQIASSGHTMEYVGSGTDYRALPENATGTFPVGANDPVTADATAGTAPNGVPVEDRQTIVLNNGAIWTAITDHNGKFRIGGDQNTDATYEVDQQRGRVTFRTGSLSIPTLIENLDTNGFNIFDSTGHVNINDELDVNSNKIVNVTDPTVAQDAATKNYVDTTTTANPIYVAAAGDTMSGELAMGSNKITGLGTPTANTDAATKLYVDSQVSVADKIQEGNSKVEVTDTGSNGTITFTTDNSPAATIDSSRRLLVGATTANTSTAGNFSPSYSKIQVRGNSNSSTGTAQLSLLRGVDTSSLANNNALSGISFGDQQAGYYANISSWVDGTPGTDDYPGRLVFSTTADGESSPTERMRISANGNLTVDTDTFFVDAVNNRVGIGVTDPAEKLEVSESGGCRIALNRSGNDGYAYIGTGTTNDLQFGRDGSGSLEYGRFDSSGRLLVGTSTARSNIYMGGASDTPKFQFEASGNNYSGQISLIQYTSASTAPTFTLGISKNNTPGANTIVASGNTLGTINFVGNDGANFRTAAQIQTLVDATPGSGDMPGRLIFSTTSPGASSPTERWRITSDGTLKNLNGSNLLIDGEIKGSDTNEVLLNFANNTLNYYVSTSGNDSTGDGTSSNPFRSLIRAFEFFPIARKKTQTFNIRILGTTYDAIGETIKGNRSNVGDYQTNLGRINIVADNGTGVTVNFNNGGWQFRELSGLYFDNINWSRTSGGQRLVFVRCPWVKVANNCSLFADGTNPGWSYLISVFNSKNFMWEGDITVGNSLTAGLGGIFTVEEGSEVTISTSCTITKTGTKFQQAAIAAIDRSLVNHAGTINNFAVGIRLGINHYGNSCGATVTMQHSTLTNLNVGVQGYYDSYIRWYYVPTITNVPTNYQINNNSRYN